MKIVGDKLSYLDERNKKLGYEITGEKTRKKSPVMDFTTGRGKNKSEGYKIIDGKTSKKTPIIDVMSGRGQPKKKEGRNLKKQVKTVLTSSVTVE